MKRLSRNSPFASLGFMAFQIQNINYVNCMSYLYNEMILYLDLLCTAMRTFRWKGSWINILNRLMVSTTNQETDSLLHLKVTVSKVKSSKS